MARSFRSHKGLDLCWEQSVTVAMQCGPLAALRFLPRWPLRHCGASVVAALCRRNRKDLEDVAPHTRRKAKAKAAPTMRASKATKLEKAAASGSTRSGTKQEAVLSLLKQPKGTTI